ncbi:MAG: hypothetical protein WA532_02775 [Candidatus Korobacteraceae bacterium]
MFTELSPEASIKTPVTFLSSLSLQCAALAVLCFLPPAAGTRAHLRSSAERAPEVTPIYFQKEPVPPAPVATKAAPEIAKAQPENKPAVKAATPVIPTPVTPAPSAPAAAAQTEVAQAAAADDSSGDGQALAPFPAWGMNATSNVAGMHHEVKAAMPVFTPDPPILHGQVPDAARGKDVVMDVMIDEQGEIVFAQVVQGVGNGVEQSIAETLRSWIFVPAKFNGVAIASQRQLTFHIPG